MQIREERLFERIINREQPAEQPGYSSLKILENSIANHLRLMLNTRQGSVQIADDFGIPDFTDLLSELNPHTIEDIQNSVRQIILKYEPRLEDVQVIHEEKKQDLRSGLVFRLESKVRFKEDEVPVVFETILEPDGKISISGEKSGS
ncbi:MAG: type VI secretion system baseplate subunit TssE [Desulfohalobiaceae bacterium]